MGIEKIYQNMDFPLDILYKSVVKITTETEATGSGFLFHTIHTQDHYKPMIVTCHHVIENASKLTLEWFDDSMNEHQCDNLQILIADVSRDFAIVTSEDLSVSGHVPIDNGDKRTFFDFGQTSRISLDPADDLPPLGSEIYAAGYPLLSNYPQFISGTVSGIEDITINGVEIPSLVLNAAINRGNSGGPVCDGDGDVIGIVFAIPNPKSVPLSNDDEYWSTLDKRITHQISQVTHFGMGYAIPMGDVQILLDYALDLEYKVGRAYQKLLQLEVPRKELARFQKYCNEKFHTPIPILSCNPKKEIWSSEGFPYKVPPNQRQYLHHIFPDVLDMILSTLL